MWVSGYDRSGRDEHYYQQCKFHIALHSPAKHSLRRRAGKASYEGEMLFFLLEVSQIPKSALLGINVRVAEDLGAKRLQLRSSTPGIRGQARLVACLLEKRFAVPAIFRRHLG